MSFYDEVYNELYGGAEQEARDLEKSKNKKRDARFAVNNALKIGKLVRSEHCEYADCKSTKLQAHHPDYDYPLDVLWLCVYHHQQLHRSFGNKVLSF